jgi:hypothetical protein
LYGGYKNDGGCSIFLTSDEGLAMAGFSNSYGAGGSDMWLIKTVPTSVHMVNNRTGWYQKVF